MNQATNKTAVLIVTTIASFMMAFMGSSLTIALPRIGIELSMDAISLGWIVTAYTMTSVICVIPFGRVADIYGRKRIYTLGMYAFMATSFLLALSNSGIMLIALRFIQGAGGALLTSTCVAILASSFPANERGKVLGINVTAVYLGFSLGPFIGGVMTQYLGWRSVFFLTVPVVLIAIIITQAKIKDEWFAARGERFDLFGSLIYSLALVAIVYGFTHLPNMFGFGLILIGTVGIIIFVIWEKRTPIPIVNIDLFWKNRAFSMSCFAALLNYGATWGVGFLLSLYLQYIKGFGPQDAGIIMVSQPLMQALVSPVSGRLSDRIQSRKLASVGMAFTVIGLLLFVFLDKDSTIAYVVAGLVLVGFGVAVFISPNTNATMAAVDKKEYGIASAAVTTMRQLGMVLSMGMILLLFTLYIGNVQITPQYHEAFLQSARMTFIIFTSLCFLGVFASLSRGKSVK
jgi:EmrB/QacA subfamily drug resistance transporter